MAKQGLTKQLILAALRNGPQTSYALGVTTDKPQPSVRRTIGSLREDGYDIRTSGTGLNATYTLVEYSASTTTQEDIDAFDTDIDAGDEDDLEGLDDGYGYEV